MAEPSSKYRVSRGTPPLVYQQVRRAQSVPAQWDGLRMPRARG